MKSAKVKFIEGGGVAGCTTRNKDDNGLPPPPGANASHEEWRTWAEAMSKAGKLAGPIVAEHAKT